MPRQRSRSTSPEVRDRNTRDIIGRPGLAGMVRTGGRHGMARGGGGNQSVLANVGSTPIESASAAQVLSMSTVGGSIASGGAIVPVDVIDDQHGFLGVPQPQGGQWVHPRSGAYVLSFSLRWAAYVYGGTVELVVDGNVVRTLVVGSWGHSMVGTVGYHAQEGSFAYLQVTHDHGSDLVCDADVDIVLSDPGDPEEITVVSTSASANLAESTRPVTVEVAAPSGLRTGDVMLALVFAVEPAVSTPSGWSRESFDSGAFDHRYALDWKTATAADTGATFSWTVDGGTDETEVMVLILAVRGADSSDPIAGTVGFERGASVSEVEPTAMPTDDAQMLIALAVSREDFPSSAAAHSVASMEEVAEVSADSSNLHVTVSAHLTQNATSSSPTVAFGVAAEEAGAYVVPLR